jgi:hypothetical protein
VQVSAGLARDLDTRTVMNRSRVTTDHDEIRRWAEQRGGKPTAVKGTSRSKKDVGMIRIDFPGYSGAGKLAPISWDEWFEKFDDSNLAMILQEETAKGQKSHFNKLVGRESVEEEGGKGAHVNKAKSRRAVRRARTSEGGKRGTASAKRSSSGRRTSSSRTSASSSRTSASSSRRGSTSSRRSSSSRGRRAGTKSSR